MPPVKKKKKRNNKKTKKSPASPPSYIRLGMSHSEYHDQRASKPIKWNERRRAVINGLKKLKAVNMNTSVNTEEIAKVAKLRGLTPKKIKLHLDPSRGHELIRQGYVDYVRFEGSRRLYFYLTKRGRRVKFIDN